MSAVSTRLVILLAALAATPRVHAQPAGAPADRTVDQARRHFERGRELFEAGRYDEAVREYEAAYALLAQPLMLFNIGLAHERAGRTAEALAAFRRYLEQDPRGPVADEAREAVDRLEAQQQASVFVAPPSAEQTFARRQRTYRWLAYGALGLGAVGLGVGVKFYLDMRAAEDELAGVVADGWGTGTAFDAEDRGLRAQRNAWLVGGAGATLLITGGVLLYLGVRSAPERPRDVALAPWALPGMGGVIVQGRF
jgi:tetratricopeptide (TPR) repeat protein